jgi:rhodanese-related sulfurtransferase|tara:strand:- start:402 stop:818 length:417 start_codon:yes stop_codon:yes gene_type:complete
MEQLLTFIGNHPLLVSLFVVLLMLFIRNEVVRGGPAIATQELVALVNQEEAVILDVRPKEEFGEGHIVGAINIPYDKLDDRFSELNRFKEKALVVVCKMGQHSGAAGLLLKKHGFEKVSRLKGGILEWRGQNLPVTKK